MAKISQFTKQNLPAVRADIDAALAAVEKKYGIKLDIGRITFYGDTFKCQMTAAIVPDVPVAKEGASADPMANILHDVDAKYIHDLKRHKGDAALLREVEILGKPAIIVGLKNMGVIFKWKPGTPDAKLQPGLRRITYRHGDRLDCAMRGVEYNEAIYKLRNNIY